MLPDAGVLATILLIVGLFLLALELMIPSFGMIGIMSAITLLISAWCAWQAWWGTSPGFFWTYAAFWLLGIPAALGGTLFLLQNTSLGDRLVLRGPRNETEDPTKESGPTGLHALIGRTGEANSLLTPGGMVVIDNDRFHAESPGMIIEQGTPIRVIDVKGNRLVVCIHDESSVAADEPSAPQDREQDAALADTVVAADLAASASDSTETDSLDFEIPES